MEICRFDLFLCPSIHILPVLGHRSSSSFEDAQSWRIATSSRFFGRILRRCGLFIVSMGSSAGATCLETLIRKASGRDLAQIPEPSKLGHFVVKEQRLYSELPLWEQTTNFITNAWVTTALRGGSGLSAGEKWANPARRPHVAHSKYLGCWPFNELVEWKCSSLFILHRFWEPQGHSVHLNSM